MTCDRGGGAGGGGGGGGGGSEGGGEGGAAVRLEWREARMVVLAHARSLSLSLSLWFSRIMGLSEGVVSFCSPRPRWRGQGGVCDSIHPRAPRARCARRRGLAAPTGDDAHLAARRLELADRRVELLELRLERRERREELLRKLDVARLELGAEVAPRLERVLAPERRDRVERLDHRRRVRAQVEHLLELSSFCRVVSYERVFIVFAARSRRRSRRDRSIGRAKRSARRDRQHEAGCAPRAR